MRTVAPVAARGLFRIMARQPSSTVDPALDAAALLRRIGFFGLFVVVPVVAQVSRRATVVLVPIAVILVIIASGIDHRQRPLREGLERLLRAPAFLAGTVAVLWAGLSLVWTPFPGPAIERFANLVLTIVLTLAGYFSLPDRMRSANLYLLPLGVAAAAGVAILIALFGNAVLRENPEGDGALVRGAIMLALLIWPAIAWLNSRDRYREALAVALLVAGTLLLAPDYGPLAALAVGTAAFGLASFRATLGARSTAMIAAGLLVVAPLLPFIARPIGSLVFGATSPGVLSLRAWQKLVASEPLRLVTGHGLETALRGRFVGLLPAEAPTTMLFELWFELGVVGALAVAVALYASIRRASLTAAPVLPGVIAAFATAFAFGCIGVGLTPIWWLTSLAITVIAFVSIERGQFRSRRPKIDLRPAAHRTPEAVPGKAQP